ncbi:hypothetical protein VWX97_15045 [Phaeobacter sp. JH18-32]|uniref:hypothetical protein n=1 Tax=Phaeobacter TaxID=302485 RepID=UPI003A84492A
MSYDLREQVRVLETIHQNMIYDRRLLVAQYQFKENEQLEIGERIAEKQTQIEAVARAIAEELGNIGPNEDVPSGLKGFYESDQDADKFYPGRARIKP